MINNYAPCKVAEKWKKLLLTLQQKLELIANFKRGNGNKSSKRL
jgi:hypothetical protein